MTNLNSRINKLETDAGIGDRHGYMLVIDYLTGWDPPEERAKGYKIQPYTVQFGGTGEQPFYIKTWPEVEAFAARPDVELHVYQFGKAPGEPDQQETTGE
jgi:hypothetical protein